MLSVIICEDEPIQTTLLVKLVQQWADQCALPVQRDLPRLHPEGGNHTGKASHPAGAASQPVPLRYARSTDYGNVSGFDE